MQLQMQQTQNMFKLIMLRLIQSSFVIVANIEPDKLRGFELNKREDCSNHKT